MNVYLRFIGGRWWLYCDDVRCRLATDAEVGEVEG